ncbi:MAG: hypothetical protein OXI87_13275 [Albidovulum sp.]|nr:hypothetical protein [Albidovulum sp.]MDE0534374.1 hypothetical protein [Albidovulum sp.]
MDRLLAGLARLTLNEVSLPGQRDGGFRMAARPAEVQKEAFRLLGIDAKKEVSKQTTG